MAPGATLESVAEALPEREKIGFLRDLGVLDQRGSALDVGFGTGAFLCALAQRGWRCSGVELTQRVELPFDPENYFEPSFGPDVLAEMELGHFDLITFWHVLPHLRDPVATLRQARRLLKPDGAVVIGVPNVGGLTAKVFGRFWHGLMPPWHLQEYTPRTLGLAMAQAGLTLTDVRGLGDIPKRIFWSSSVTNIIDAIPQTWWRAPAVLGLRVLRRATVVGMPLLLRAEEALGLPGAIMAIGRQNALAAALEESTEQLVAANAGTGSQPRRPEPIPSEAE